MNEEARGRSLPGLQATMADLVAEGKVRYAPDSATWYEGPEVGDVARRARGRTLRDLRRAGLIEADLDAAPDGRRAYPVVLTEAGQARHRTKVG